MACKSKSKQPTDFDESLPKKMKEESNTSDELKKSDVDHQKQQSLFDVSLEIVYKGFKAPPVYETTHKLDDLPDFLVTHGARIRSLSYAEDAGESNRQLIIKHCPNISEVKFEFTEYPDQVDDDESQRLVKFLTALAPGLTSLETINNLIGLHYLSCMGYIYENFTNKIKFVKTDELKPEELSVLSGDNNKNNPALSLEELVYCDNDFLYSKKRNSQSAESLALKPASLTDLVKLTNLRRIDLPFFLSKEKIPPVTAPLPLLEYASIRLLSNRRGNVATTAFIQNIGKALANVRELKLDGLDPGLMVLTNTLKNCQTLKKLDLSTYHVADDYNLTLAKLADVKPKFEELTARNHSRYSNEIHVILYLFNNVSTIATIDIDQIDDQECLDKFVATAMSLSEKVHHNVKLNLKWSHRASNDNKNKAPKELPTNMPDNLIVALNFSD